MLGREELLQRQKTLADFGQFVLDNDDLQKILTEGCRLISEALGTDFAKVIEIERDKGIGRVRAGVGWKEGVVGKACIELNDRSSEAYAIEHGEPLVTQNIAEEHRFEFAPFLKDHGVVAMVNVPIMVPGRKPWGLLQVDSRHPRDFDEEDVEFLRTYAMVLGPVIDRVETIAELSATDERLRLIIENARGYAIIVSDADDIITDWLGDSEQILGWSAEEAIGQPTSVIFTPEDRDAGIPEQEIGGARERGAAPNLRWHVRRDGGRIFLDGQTIALEDGDGRRRGFLKIGQDVTERRRNEERQATLLAELQHRVRNVLAMVRSVIGRSIAGAASIEGLRAQLEGRIDALARTQALLTRSLGVGIDLETLIRDELDAQAADFASIRMEGPKVELASKAAEVVTLAVHELATNAVKYGSLSGNGGQLEVTWQLDNGQTPPWLRLHWRESGVTVAASGERRSGFGTELITRRVPYELRGRGRLDLHDDGIGAAIEFPLVEQASTLETGAPA